jgi:XTP/dITP diphosphohydrolase
VNERPVLVCASANPGKVAELAALLAAQVDLLARPDHVGDVDETADTLVGNARLKAKAICDATGLPAVADDTGLEVDALGGAPGVYTARFARAGATDAENRAHLLEVLRDVVGSDRSARFRTVMLVRRPDGSEIIAEGVCEGRIASTERGTRGFGYDPLFVPAVGDGRTFAEMTDDEKNEISHRGRAVRALIGLLASGPVIG